MDKYLGVNVYDARDNAIAGAEVTFKVKFKGTEKVLGPIQIQGIKDKPASIQIPTEIDDPVIEVTGSYDRHSKTVLVDTRQTVTTIIKLDEVNPEPSDPEPERSDRNSGPSPLQVLNMARQAVPAVNYALGVAGIAAAGAIITLFLGWTKASIVLVGLIFVGMILLFLFAQLVIAKSRSIQIAGIVLLWAVLLFFVTFLAFTVTAFAGEWPRPWAVFLGITQTTAHAETAHVESAHADSTHAKIPGGTGWVFLGYFNSQTGGFTEGPKAEVIFSDMKLRQHFYEVGDTIRLKLASKVYIVDYATTKTDLNLTAPVKKGVVSIADETGLVLPAGTELILRDVAFGSWPGNPNEAIWGRVVYADEN